MSERHVTLYDIARACGVSRSTVSLVVRGSGPVSDNTRALVERELARQKYVYNRAAASLREGRSTQIAVVVDDLSNPFFAEFVSGVDSVLGATGYITILGSTNESVKKELNIIKSLKEHNVGGLILSPAYGSTIKKLREAVGNGFPIILFNNNLKYDGWDYVNLDNSNGVYEITRYLFQRGHRHIVFYGGVAGLQPFMERRKGYEQAMAEFGNDVAPMRVIEVPPNREQAAKSASRIFQKDREASAVVCYNDVVAFGVIEWLRSNGYEVGREIDVTGFDGIVESRFSAPSLTTHDVNPKDCGAEVTRYLLQRIREPDASPTHVIRPGKLVVRGSTGG